MTTDVLQNKLEKLLSNFRNIKTDELSTVMNIRPNMARKYKKEPWKYDPPTSKAIEVELAFGIPVIFWKDIKSYVNRNISDSEALSEIEKNNKSIKEKV